MTRTLREIQDENANLIRILDCDSRYIYVIDAETSQILFANKSVQGMWNKTEPYLGEICYKYIKGEDKPCANCSVPFLKPGQQVFFRQRHYDNNLNVWLNITVCRTVWKQKSAYYINVENITEEEINKQKIEQDNALIKSISLQSYEFVAIIDTKDRTISFREVNHSKENSAPSISSNYDEDSLYAIEHLVVPEEKERCRKLSRLENIMSELGHKDVYSYNWTQPYSDGSAGRKQLSFWWLDRANNKMLCIKSDVSEVYEQEQQHLAELRASKLAADKANATKSRFLANMSHDMRTPLHSILGVAALAKGELNDPASMEKYWGTVTLAGDYLLALINDILDMAKIEENSLKLNFEPYNYEEFKKYIQGLFGQECELKNIKLSFKNLDNPMTVLTDITRFNQIFFNILSNAVKFTPRGGTIGYVAHLISLDDEYVEVEHEVWDTGVGMSPEFQKKMFQPFEQEKENANKGTGLGLAITKRLVDLFQGTIKVTSKLGEGTNIKIRLKMKLCKEELHAQKCAEEELALQGKKILLAEDHHLNQIITKKLLEREGMEVACANNGQEAVNAFQASKPYTFDLILMDMRMPGLNGAEATRAIRALTREDAAKIPIIALTANAYAEDILEARQAGMNDHLSKPIITDKFFATIKQWIYKKQ